MKPLVAAVRARVLQLGKTVARPFKSAGFTAWVILLSLTVTVVIVALSGSRSSSPMSADDLKDNTFSVGLIDPEQMGRISLAADPTLDLAPSLDGVLYGQIRVPFRAVPTLDADNPGPIFLWALPRSAEIDISRAVTFALDQTMTGEYPWYSCGDSTRGISLNLLHEQKLYSDLIRVDCSSVTETRILVFPPGGLSETESSPESLGSSVELAWAPTLDFRVPEYVGINREVDDSIRYVVQVDQLRLADLAVFEYDAKARTHKSLVRLTPWNENEDLQPDVPSDISAPHYDEFGAGISHISTLSEDQVFFTATGSVQDADPSLLSRAGANPWIMLLLGVLGASLQVFIRACILRIAPWKP